MQPWHRIFLILCLIPLIAGFLPKIVFKTAEITVQTEVIKMPFTVEIADTPAKRKKGLMKRESLARDHGMLFIFEKEIPLSFWMKDTPLSLDIIYFDKNGLYINHHPETTPFSEKNLRSDAPAQYVLEINAGIAEEIQLKVGSHLLLPKQLQ